jgi:hypothetical protein
MATPLTAAALKTVKIAGNGRTSKADWTQRVYDLLDAGEPVGNLELDYPGVKPAHVHHMLRLIVKEQGLAAQVGMSEEYGVCFIPTQA